MHGILDGTVKAGDVVVIAYEGPAGGPGFSVVAVLLASYGVALYGFCKRHTVGTCHICVYKPRYSQITQYGEDAAGVVYIVDMVSGVWRYFAQQHSRC